eukprot:scaffold54529_cov15-Tisochrysis_lutea.AAC.1
MFHACCQLSLAQQLLLLCLQDDEPTLSGPRFFAPSPVVRPFHTSKEALNEKQGGVGVKEEQEEEAEEDAEWEECNKDQGRVKAEEEDVKPDIVDLVEEEEEKQLPMKLGLENGLRNNGLTSRDGQQCASGGDQPQQEIKVEIKRCLRVLGNAWRCCLTRTFFCSNTSECACEQAGNEGNWDNEVACLLACVPGTYSSLFGAF